MYAIIKTGGKQYRVKEGDIIRVEKLPDEAGSKIVLNDVLLLKDEEKTEVGTPNVEGATVEAEVLRHGRDRKIRVSTFKRRKGYKRTLGHRQEFTELRIDKVNRGSG